MAQLVPVDYFIYQAVITMTDDSGTTLDLEEKGWADKEVLSRTKVFSITPKAADSAFPTIVVNIPDGAKPVFKTRVFGNIALSGGEGGHKFRCYGVGYKLGSQEILTWVLPTGDIEVGPDPKIAEQLVNIM